MHDLYISRELFYKLDLGFLEFLSLNFLIQSSAWNVFIFLVMFLIVKPKWSIYFSPLILISLMMYQKMENLKDFILIKLSATYLLWDSSTKITLQKNGCEGVM